MAAFTGVQSPMRTMFAFAALSGILVLAACDNAAEAPDAASAPAEAATPPAPKLADLNGCMVRAEAAAGERMVGAKREMPIDANGSYVVKIKGEDSGADYTVTCSGTDQTTDFVLMESAVTGGVRNTDLPTVAPKLSNVGRVTLGQDVEIASALWSRGEVGAGNMLDKFFVAIPFNAPGNARYCVSVVAKFAAKTGKGSTNIAFDQDEWKVWGHIVEDGVNFDTPYSQPLTAGEHVIYLKKRENKISRLKIEQCPG